MMLFPNLQLLPQTPIGATIPPVMLFFILRWSAKKSIKHPSFNSWYLGQIHAKILGNRIFLTVVTGGLHCLGLPFNGKAWARIPSQITRYGILHKSTVFVFVQAQAQPGIVADVICMFAYLLSIFRFIYLRIWIQCVWCQSFHSRIEGKCEK